MLNDPSVYDNPTLIENFNEGKMGTYKDVYEHFKNSIFYFTKKLISNSGQSEEIVHDSFYKLFMRSSDFKSLQHIKVFLYSTTKNACINLMKKEKVVNRREDVAFFSEANWQCNSTESASLAAIETELVTKIVARVETLPSRQRDIFKMHVYENKRISDIANQLQISKSCVSYHLSKAKLGLRWNISHTASPNTSPVETEYLHANDILKKPETKIEIVKYSPSFGILEKILNRGLKIDDLNWREFEKLIAQLLESDGFNIELMQGTKDGGVDIIATKLHDITGYYKTLWQAKKYSKNKVSINTIRELADSVNEFKASKGIIVTATYLTKDALYRVERDKYILSKVDRIDLDNWINSILCR